MQTTMSRIMKPGESTAGDAREETKEGGRGKRCGSGRGAAVISSSVTTRDAGPAPRDQAVILRAGQPAGEEGHRNRYTRMTT